MADEKKNESNGLTGAVPITAVLALLASFVISNLSPFHDDRPPGAPLKSQQYEGAQDINARLWEDPLVAVDALDNTNNKDAAENDSHKPGQIYKYNPIYKEDQVTVVAVTLPGSPYQDAAESRMRWRYAVLSALANQKYNPIDEQHIGYFQASIPTKDQSHDNDHKLSTKVAFEWWLQDKDNTKKVLLLWINESSLGKNPAATLKCILSQTNFDSKESSSENKCKGVSDTEDSSRKIRDVKFNNIVLGPNSSTLLEDMLKEVKLKEVKDNKENELGEINSKKIAYYSAAATAGDSLLLKVLSKKDVDNNDVDNNTVQAYLQQKGITFYRTTATDAEMMQVIADELTTLHRIEKTDHIVILSEWDTLYGRSISEAFKSAWAPKDPDRVIGQFSYMRGLDGKLPNNSEKEKSEKEADLPKKNPDTKEENKSEAAKALELPEGRNQKDSLRRLSEYIQDLDKEYKNKGDSKGITVIGVLGSDIRDKFMILEALRPYFKHKLFFTTDLDAAYYHPTKWHQTHNMLVASAFDLKLRPELQGQIPPFRDSYQTALFLATQMLVNNIKITEHQQKVPAMSDEQKQFINTPSPLLFEIGRHRPIHLKLKNDTGETESINPKCTWKEVEGECKSTVQPPYVNPQSNLTGKDVGMLILSFSIGIVFLFFISSRFRVGVKFVYSMFKDRPWFTTVALIVGVFIFWRVGTYITQVSTEPFYWLEGVSIWPSQILRLSVILFAGIFFYWGYHHIKKEYKNDPLISILTAYANAKPQKLNSMLLIEYETSESTSNNSLKSSLISIITSSVNPKHKQLWDIFFIGDWKPINVSDYGSKVNPEVTWKKYTEYFEWDKPIISCQWVLRIILHSVVFFASAALLILVTDLPNSPARDDVAYYTNIAIIIVAVFCTLLLNIWVVENARLCKKLIEHLSVNPSEWHSKAVTWATNEKYIALECVNDWLDIYLVTQLTKIIQPLIWGPIGCLALMLLARSPVTDDWDLPVGLEIVFMFMLCYVISAEVFLQRGAQQARTKAIDQLTDKINTERNHRMPNDNKIKRIEVEIGRIKDLREGAFLPWYQLPVLQSFGGLSSLWLVLQYIANLVEKGGAL